MTADVYDFQVEIERRRIGSTTPAHSGECDHLNLSLEPHGHIVRCRDCGDQVDPYWVIERMTQNREREVQKREAEKAELEALRDQTIHLKAARKVEKLWRGKKRAPCCPHCYSAILPGDGLGDNWMSHDLAAQRRKKRESEE